MQFLVDTLYYFAFGFGLVSAVFIATWILGFIITISFFYLSDFYNYIKSKLGEPK